MALRYAGSQHFNLEAHDRNWMARLLASYAHTDFVFIDVRDITVHVANEIRLSYLAMGAERCVFIVDPALPGTEWVSRIHELLGCDPGSPLILHLLTYPGDASVQPEQFVRLTRSVIERVPEGLPLINEEEIAFVEARVASKDWVTHFWETDRGMRWCAIGLSAVLYFVLLIIASALDLGLSGVEGEFAHLFLNLCQLIILVLIGFVFWASFLLCDGVGAGMETSLFRTPLSSSRRAQPLLETGIFPGFDADSRGCHRSWHRGVFTLRGST
jgi:hypothetical protein